MKPAYRDQLKDPRWQRKRLEVMHRDNFKCRKCDNGEITLNVHHIAYVFRWKPWEYPDYYLITLCESCHELENPIMAKDAIVELQNIGYFSQDFDRLANYIANNPDFFMALRRALQEASHV